MLSAIFGCVLFFGAIVFFFFLFRSEFKRIREAEVRADMNCMNLQRIADALNNKKGV